MNIIIGVFVACAVVTSRGQDVRLPPFIIRETEEPETFTSHSAALHLTCEAGGYPPPEYEWIIDGSTLVFPVEARPGTGNITIETFSPTYVGEYQCFAFSQYGTTMTRKISVRWARIAQFPNEEVVHHTKNVGEGLKVVCNSAPKSVPAATVSWSVVESPSISNPETKNVPLTRRVQIDEYGSLVFANLAKSDEVNGWVYRCNLENNIAGNSAFGSYTRITVADAPIGKRTPRILSYTSNLEKPVIAIKNTVLSLRCFFEGVPTPSVKWERVDGKSLSRANYEQKTTILKINNTDYYDEATYRCIGTNQEGSSFQDITVDVQEIPNFVGDRKPTNLNVTDGMDVEFHCETNAEPVADITWYINGKALTDANQPARVSVSEDRKVLRVTKACKDCKSGSSDLRVYACEAKNIHGAAFSAGYLNVLMPTILTEPPINQQLTYGETNITFKCGGITDDSTALKVTWWRNKYRIEEVAGELFAVDTPQGSSLFIILDHLTNETKTDYLGKYTCVFFNGYSDVNATATLLEDPNSPGFVVDPGTTVASLWWVFLVLGILLLLLLVVLCCCLYMRRSKGDEYDVDEKERLNGFDPDQEMAKAGYHEYQRPEVKTVMGSRASLNSTNKLDDDGTSLDDYMGPGQFNEDGSFIGIYNTTERRRNESHL